MLLFGFRVVNVEATSPRIDTPQTNHRAPYRRSATLDSIGGSCGKRASSMPPRLRLLEMFALEYDDTPLDPKSLEFAMGAVNLVSCLNAAAIGHEFRVVRYLVEEGAGKFS